MPQQSVATDQFGLMTLDARTGYYEARPDVPILSSQRVSIAAENFETGLARMHDFLAWLETNHQAFKLPLERAIQDWDDVWDSVLGSEWVDADEGFLAEYLTYESATFDGRTIYLSINTSGLHTDHMIRIAVNEAMEIERCELL